MVLHAMPTGFRCELVRQCLSNNVTLPLGWGYTQGALFESWLTVSLRDGRYFLYIIRLDWSFFWVRAAAASQISSLFRKVVLQDHKSVEKTLTGTNGIFFLNLSLYCASNFTWGGDTKHSISMD